MISQEFLVKDFLPYLLQHGFVYRKFKQVKARPAKAGEKIVSITSDGIETTNTAKEGDYVVENITDAGEQYIIGPASFQEKYTLAERQEDGWNVYDPKGKIVAIEMNASNLELFGWQAPFHIQAPWQESMIVKQDDFLVTPLPDSDEVYRLARKEFFETYTEIPGDENPGFQSEG